LQSLRLKQLAGSRRTNYRRLVLAILRCKGPLTDAMLAWWIRVVYRMNPRTAVATRGRLTRKKEVRFARRVHISESGRLAKMWEVVPCTNQPNSPN
jgi:hypothetical protein